MSKKRMRRSNHSAIRISERCNIIDTTTKQLVELAYYKGYTIKHFTGVVEKYILDKMGDRCNGTYKYVRYREYLFIFAHNKRLLVTMYELPQEIKNAYREQIKENRKWN